MIFCYWALLWHEWWKLIKKENEVETILTKLMRAISNVRAKNEGSLLFLQSPDLWPSKSVFFLFQLWSISPERNTNRLCAIEINEKNPINRGSIRTKWLSCVQHVGIEFF